VWLWLAVVVAALLLIGVLLSGEWLVYGFRDRPYPPY
jgi:hypothetical protein